MWDDDRYDDDYDDRRRGRGRGHRDDSVLDDLVEMLLKLVGVVLAIAAVIYGLAWCVDSLGWFDTHLTDDFTNWVKGLFDNADSTPEKKPAP